MAKKLELNFSSSKDAEIVRFLQLNSNSNTSPIMICALEYFIKTGHYLKIANVCVIPLQNTEVKIRKPIYVPNNSIVEQWADDQKELRKGMLSAKVRHILRNSLNVVDKEEDEEVIDYVECLMKVQGIDEKPLIEDVPGYNEDEIPGPIPQETVYPQPTATLNIDRRRDIKEPDRRTERSYSTDDNEDSGSKGGGARLLSKMMPRFDDYDD